MTSLSLRPWRVPALLIALGLVPFAATANRLAWIISGGERPDPAMDRFNGDWSMLAVHIVLGASFILLSTTQFSPGLRARYPHWHRSAGKPAMICGFIAGLSGVWLVVVYPPSELATPFMDGVRIVIGTALAGSILLAYREVRRRNIAAHRAWMIRAFSLAVAGSTQALIIGVWLAAVGELTPESATALNTLGFLINIVIAEWRIRAARTPSYGIDTHRTLS